MVRARIAPYVVMGGGVMQSFDELKLANLSAVLHPSGP